MGGGAMNIDLPINQFKPTSPSTSSPSLNFPLSANSNSQNQALNNKQPCTSTLSCSSCGGSTKQGFVHRVEDKREGGSSLFSAVIGSVPSKVEVESAIASLQSRYMHDISSSGYKKNQLQQILESFDARTLFPAGYGRIREALLLLQTDPSFKRMVVSLSSDRALWNAIVNNEMVRKVLGDSCIPGENRRLRSSDDEVDQLGSMVGWILDIAKAKVIELIHKFQSLIDEVFQQLEKGDQNQIRDSTDKVDDKIASSLLLSVVILLIVVLARAGRA